MLLKIENDIDKETFVKMTDRLSYIRKQIRNVSHSLIEPYVDINSNNLLELIRLLLVDYTYLMPQINFDFNYFPNFINKNNYKSNQLLIICKELINNAITHGKSTNIDVNITEHDNHIIVIIEDNGMGFNTSQYTQGIGLKNINKRIHEIGGTLNIESSPKTGSTFIIKLFKHESSNS